jgi:polar amino acid transport system substrate-binding protein
MCLDHAIRFAHYESGLAYDSSYGGIDDDVLKELMRRSSCKFVVTVQPRIRAWYNLKSGNLDMVGTGIETAERRMFAWFYPYIYEDNFIVLGSRVPKDVHSFDQFMKIPDLKLGGVRSFRYSPYYDKYVDQLIMEKRIFETAQPETIYMMFSSNRIDALISNQLSLSYYVKKLKIAGRLRVERWDPAGLTPSGLVLSKKSFSKEQSQKWRALIGEMLDDGTIEKITIRHLGQELGAKTVFQRVLRDDKIDQK